MGLFSDFLKECIDDMEKDVVIFRFSPVKLTAFNPKTKKMAKATIQLPKEICGEDLRELRKWGIYLIAIPKQRIDKYNEILEAWNKNEIIKS